MFPTRFFRSTTRVRACSLARRFCPTTSITGCTNRGHPILVAQVCYRGHFFCKCSLWWPSANVCTRGLFEKDDSGCPRSLKPELDSDKHYKAPSALNSVPSDTQHQVRLQQYKAYLGDLGNIGKRYATVQGFYVSVMAALISVLALSESNTILSQLKTNTLVVVCLFAVALSIVGALTIRYYKKLFRAKFGVLKALEETFAS